MKNRLKRLNSIFLALIFAVMVVGCSEKAKTTDTVNQSAAQTGTTVLKEESQEHKTTSITAKSETQLEISEIPEYKGKPYVSIHQNKPEFLKEEIKAKSFEAYSTLDDLGRCGMAVACVGWDIMPKEKRGAIGSVKPSGWHTVKYDFVDGKYLYNRCHLIGYQLTGENANEKNLITGTRYLNVEGMLPFENMVADYVKETRKHVMYRVKPVYKGKNLLAEGVQIEGYSVEDKGKSISFNVFCYNVQPGVKIDYTTGKSSSDKPAKSDAMTKETKSYHQSDKNGASKEYVLNLNTHKFHLPSCGSVKSMNATNKGVYTGTKEDLIHQGYEPCKNCNP